MIIYPAIDVKDKKCVRLTQGRYDKVTVYGEDLLQIAIKWQDAGAKYLHMVDLDGARDGQQSNLDVISEVAKKLNIPVQMGGGIRSMEAIEKVLSSGVSRVILGTSAVKNPELVEIALKEYGSKIVIGIDAKDGYVAIEGWEQTSEFKAVDFAKKMELLGAKTIIYTDIARDGMLSGPNLKAMEEMAKSTTMEVIASGGVANLQDIIDLKNAGMPGVIVGKALYTGGVDLEEAVKVIDN